MLDLSDSRSLLAHCRTTLGTIRQEYDASLHEKTIKPSLKISVKNFMENLRSALDYGAVALFNRYGSAGGKKPHIYFPYATSKQSLADFRTAKRVEACIPGLTSSRPDIASLLESFQHWAQGFEWLPRFMDLNNTNKHQELTPQTRSATKELRVSSSGASMSIGEGASISIGHGASIQIGGAVIRGGQTISPSSPPIVGGQGKVEVITWVSFSFTATGDPVLQLLEASLVGTERIVAKLEAT